MIENQCKLLSKESMMSQKSQYDSKKIVESPLIPEMEISCIEYAANLDD